MNDRDYLLDAFGAGADAEWMSNPDCNCRVAVGASSREIQHHADQWYPESGRSAAKTLCAGCPVVNECLAFALDNDEQGVWGATNEEDRRKLTGADAA